MSTIQITANDIKRGWINQPSTLQVAHKWHGIRVLYAPYTDDSYAVFFLQGEVVSMILPRLCVSHDGMWPESSRVGP